jgi:hypothetical protein
MHGGKNTNHYDELCTRGSGRIYYYIIQRQGWDLAVLCYDETVVKPRIGFPRVREQGKSKPHVFCLMLPLEDIKAKSLHTWGKKDLRTCL